MSERKLINFWRDGIPVESGEPQTDHLVLRAVTPDECEGTILLGENRSLQTVYEVCNIGPDVTRFKPRDIVLPVFEALRMAGEHLVCREREITIRWAREQLLAPEVTDVAA